VSTPGGYTPFFNLILPTVGGNAVDWATWTNQNWQSVDTALQALTDGKLSNNPEDGTLYGRMDGEWVQIEVDGSTVTVGIGEAPDDGEPYLRQSETWVAAEPIIEAIVDDAVDDVLSPILRTASPAVVEVTENLDYLDVTLSHSDLRDASVKARITGAFIATGAGEYSAEIAIVFDGVARWQSDVKFTAENACTLPFILDFVLADIGGTSQYLTGTFIYTDEDAEVTTAGSGGMVKSGSVFAPAKANGGPISSAFSVSLAGAGTKNLKVNFELLAEPSALSSVALELLFVAREGF